MREIRPWFGLLDTPRATAEVMVLGCPFEDSDCFRPGATEAPASIRRWTATEEAVTEEGLSITDLRVVDLGDVEHRSTAPGSRWQAIESAATAAWNKHPEAFLLTLGGDHGITPPLVASTRAVHEDLAYLMLDCHPDAFDTYAGDPLSHASVLTRLWDRAGLQPAATVLLGVRSFAHEEVPTLKRAAKVITARQWAKLGTAAVVDQIDEIIGGRPLYLSFDIDVLDPACAPAVPYPVPAGPNTREVLDLFDRLWQGQEIVAMDLVEVAPALDPSDITSAAAAHMLLQVLGFIAR